MPFPAFPTQVACPRCQTRFVVEVRTILDIGQEPELKNAFLSGQVNYASCPNCGAGGTLSTPLVYHDPAKELLITYVPTEAQLAADEEEKLVGSLVSTVMNAMPQDQRKGYFLRPRRALTMEGLYDAILEADGYSKEMLDEQRLRVGLVNELAVNVDDDKTLDELVEQNRDHLDYDFFLILSSLIERHREEGDEERAEALTQLRDKLLQRVNLQALAAQAGDSLEGLIDQFLKAGEGRAFSQLVAVNRPALDYAFFQALTAQIEAAQQAGDTARAEQLGQLRQRLLAELENQEKLVREAQDEASLLIMQLSESENLEQAVRENIEQINEVFLAVLMRLIDTARSRNNAQRLTKLSRILETTLDTLEEKLPPVQRLINKLARSEYPDGTNRVLEQNRRVLSQDFLKELDGYIADVKQSGDEELAQHLTQARAQAAAKLTILRA